MPSLESLGIDRLTVAERLLLMEQIWQSIDDSTLNSELTPEQAAELDRRCAEYDANPANVITWEQVEAAALARLKR